MRRVIFSGILAIIPTICASATRGSVLEGPIVDPANGNSYYLLSQDTWTGSEATARSMGGNLAVITSAAENAWIFNTFDPEASSLPGDMWIGLSDPDINDGTGSQHAADFQWVDGTPKTYTNWSAGEPNNDPNLGGEYYACMVGYPAFGETPGEWNDKTNSGSLTASYPIVQVPEPSSLAIVAGVFLSLGMSRRNRQRSRCR